MSICPIIIVGASAAGIAALSTVRRLLPQVPVVCIDQESNQPYNTCLLVSCLAKTKQFSDTQLLAASWYTDPLISWYLGTRVIALDTKSKSVLLDTGQEISYSKLLLAVGAVPALAPEHKLWLEKYRNIYTFYTATDLHKIVSYIQEHGVTCVAILGAGLTGVECADALARLNIKVWLIESQKSIVSHLLNEQASLWLLQKIPATLTVITQACVQSVHADMRNRQIRTLVINNGQELQELPVQLVIIVTGVQPATALAEQAGLQLQQVGQVGNKWGIAVDKLFQTSAHDVYAAGDCAVYGLLCTTTWTAALAQGIHAAYSLAGVSALYPEYKGIENYGTTRVFGVPMGYCDRRTDRAKSIIHWYNKQDEYYSVFVHMRTGLVQGGVVMGSLQRLQRIKQACHVGACYDASMFS